MEEAATPQPGATAESSPQPPPVRAGHRAWLGLSIVLGPVLLVSMDGSILFLTMPTITQALAPTAGQALWILDIYGLVVGSLLIASGNLGDRFGRLRLLMIGTVIFGTGSIGAAASTSPEFLIASRALMGLGGAALLPSGLAVISELFEDARQRAQAIGIFAATFAAGFAIGPVVGGALLTQFAWGSVFLINLPVVAVFLVFAPVILREVRVARTSRIDVLSVVLSSVGVLLTVYAIKDLAAHEASLLAVMIGAAGVAVLVWFVSRQRKITNPLIDVGLFRSPVFSIAILTGFLSLFAWSAAAYLTGVYLQSVLEFSVREASFLMLPGAAVLIVVCILTPRFTARLGARRMLVVSHFSMAVGLSFLLLTTVTTGVGWFIASTVVAGIGYGISFALVADTAVGAVSADRAGSAGAIAETSNEIGNALGIAVLGSIAALVFRVAGPDVAPTLEETLITTPAMSVALHAKSAFLVGMHVALGLAAALAAGLGVLTLMRAPDDRSK